MARTEFDHTWQAALKHDPVGVDKMCDEAIDDLERQFQDMPTMAQLAPLYGIELPEGQRGVR